MAEPSVKRFVFLSFFLYGMLPSPSWAAYTPILSGKEVGTDLEDLKRLRGSGEEADSLLEFFKHRTHLGVGVEERYDTNILLDRRDAEREDYVSTLESRALFADPRGALLYGIEGEVYAYRYHILTKNAIDENLRSFIDFDPGGRIQFHSEYYLVVANSLVLGADGGDILRRSTDFQRSVEHTGIGSLRYALNETNALASKVDYSVYDDQTVNDAATDRRRFHATLDLDHDLTPTWILFGGYSFQDTFIPGEKTKNTKIHSGRFGVRHDLREGEKERLEATLELQRSEFHVGTTATDLSFTGSWTHELSPRTSFKLGYEDTHGTSFSAGRLRYRNRKPSVTILYQLTPLMDLSGGGEYSLQTSGSKDAVPGSTATAEKNTTLNLFAELKWQIREQTRIDLKYKYGRSPTRDYTAQDTELKIEMLF